MGIAVLRDQLLKQNDLILEYLNGLGISSWGQIHHGWWRVVVGVFLSLLLFASFAVWAERDPDYVNALWLVHKHGVLKIATVDGRTLFRLNPFKGIQCVAVDAKRGVVWLARKTALDRYRFNSA